MNIQAIYSSSETPSVAGVASPVSARSPISVEPDTGAAATVWVSPPGLFFSVLHQLSQQYPTELKAALASVLGPDAVASTAVGSEIVSRSAPTRLVGASSTRMAKRMLASVDVGRSTGATPEHTLGQLIEFVSQVAHLDPPDFVVLAQDVAASVAVIADGVTRPDAEPMAILASQLNLAAQIGREPDRRALVVAVGEEPRDLDRVGVVRPSEGVGDHELTSSPRHPAR